MWLIALGIWLLSRQISANCIKDKAIYLNHISYPQFRCVNIKAADLGSQLINNRRNFLLSLDSIDFQDLKSIANFPYDPVEHLVITNNTQGIRDDAFIAFSFLRSLEIQGGSLPHFSGFRINPYYGVFSKLKMSKNNILTIKAICNNSKMLKSVEIIYNNINEIKSDTFASCGQLTELNLFSNEIQKLEPGSFSGLDNITRLNLGSNKIYKINRNVFLGLSSLKNLDVSNCSIDYVESGAFNGLSGLLYLNLSYNNLTELANETFNQTYRLEKLDLSHNNLRWIKSLAFYGLGKLSWLNLKSNRLANIRTNAFLGLSTLRELDLTNLSIASMEPGAFNGLFNLQKLDLRYNNLTELPTETFNQTYKLEKLDLSHNNLRWIKSHAFYGLAKLSWLNLKSSRLANISTNAFLGLSTLRELDLTNLSIASMESGAFNGLFNLQKLDLRYNNLTELATNTFNQTLQLTILKITHNNMQRIGFGALNALDKVVNLSMSNCELKHFHCNTSDSNLIDIYFLNLSRNRLGMIDVCAFRQFESLKLLDLSHNLLSHLLQGTFSPFSELQELDLSNNQLQDMDAALMFPLVILRSLDVSENFLNNWNVRLIVSHMGHLTDLDLSANIWHCDYLTQVLQYLATRAVNTKPRQSRIYDKNNVQGIECSSSDKNNSQKNGNITNDESCHLNMLRLFVEMKRNDEFNIHSLMEMLKDKRLLTKEENENQFVDHFKNTYLEMNVTIEILREISRQISLASNLIQTNMKETRAHLITESIERNQTAVAIKKIARLLENLNSKNSSASNNFNISSNRTNSNVLLNDNSVDLSDLVKPLYIIMILMFTAVFIFSAYVMVMFYKNNLEKSRSRRRCSDTILETLNVIH